VANEVACYNQLVPATAPLEDTIVRAERALTDLIRLFNRPAVQRRLMAQADIAIEVSACWALGRLGQLGPSRPSDLATSLGVDASSITHRVQALERAGYVERLADPADGRACVVGLSAAGAAALARLRAARGAFIERLLAGWEDEERNTFSLALDRVREALETEIREA
jgi:DNA-binding MarR family transcriptional regulator